MESTISRRTIKGHYGQYINVAIYLVIGLALLSAVLLNKIQIDAETRILIIASAYILPALCMLILLHYRPLMKIDDEYLYLRPIIFKKEITTPLKNIKCVKMYHLVDKIITSAIQAKQNHTLIISLIEGREITFDVQGLSKKVRKQMESLLSSRDIKVEIVLAKT